MFQRKGRIIADEGEVKGETYVTIVGRDEKDVGTRSSLSQTEREDLILFYTL